MSDPEPPAAPPPAVTADEFLQLVQQSGLVPPQRRDAVEAAVAAWQSAPGAMPDSCRQALVEANLLTEWQIQKLLKRAGQTAFFIDSFKLLKPLGQGGMGSVYLAEHTDHDQVVHRVAIKLLPKRLQDKGQYLTRFQQENWVAARLKHEHIARAWDDFSESRGDAAYQYSVMDYIEGEDLDRRVRKKGPLTAQAAAEFIQQAAKGLQYAHDRGLVHRDIKPANLMVDTTGKLKILDFGLVQTEDDDEHARSLKKDEHRKSLGTPDYMSPEQAKADRPVDHRSDIYSLGCTFYFLLTGRAPYDHVTGDAGGKGTRIARMTAHSDKQTQPPDLLEKRPRLPAKLVDLVRKMMAKSPGDRPQSAQEVDDALFVLLSGYELEDFDRNEAAAATGRTAGDAAAGATASSNTGSQPTARPSATSVAPRSSAGPAPRSGPAGGSLGPRPRVDAMGRPADTPPPSSSSRSTGRLPAAGPPRAGATRPNSATSVPATAATASAAPRPAASGQARGPAASPSPAAAAGSWSRRVAGLPIAAWLGIAAGLVALVVAVAIVTALGTVRSDVPPKDNAASEIDSPP